MTVDKVKELFADKLEGDNLILNEYRYRISIAEFTKEFKDVSENPTYNDFIKIDGYEDESNVGKGYKDFFDQCKEEGILN